ncbi:MAG: methyl-accepting chemotaxis protein, partial [Magnetococcales bacterium]|nr:methyl-accepting chemotaxis protein [Magnetococcales bacterium]
MQFLKRYSLKAQITVLVAILLGLSIALSLFAAWKMNVIGQEIKAVAEEHMPLTETVTSITAHQLEQAVMFER